MTTAATPAPAKSQYSLTTPPPGSSFVYDEVKTDRGQTSLGQVPLLTWGESEEDVMNMIAYYGNEGISNIVNGTSLRVSFQGIARRGKDPKKNWSDEKIAQEQIDFRPGKREGGQSTPQSRLANQAKKVAGQVNADFMAELIGKIARKEIDPALLRAAGFDPDAFFTPVPSTPAAEPANNGAEEVEEEETDTEEETTT